MIFTLFSVLVIRNFYKLGKQYNGEFRTETGCTAMGQCNTKYPIVSLAWTERDAHVTCFNGIFRAWLLYNVTRLNTQPHRSAI